MKVELNFSEHAGDEAMAIAVWRAMTGMGRGRAQSLFRQCVIAGLRNMRESDLPEDVYALISQGVKPVKREKKKEAPVTGEGILLPGLIAEDHILSKSRTRKKDVRASDQDAPIALPEEIPPHAPQEQASSTPPEEEKVPQVEPDTTERKSLAEEPIQTETPAPTPSTETASPPPPPTPEPSAPEMLRSAENVVKPSHRKRPMFQGIMG